MGAVDELKQEWARQDRPQPDDGETEDFHSVPRGPHAPRPARPALPMPAVDRGLYDPAVVNRLPYRAAICAGVLIMAIGLVLWLAGLPAVVFVPVLAVGFAVGLAGLLGFPVSPVLPAVERAYGVRILAVRPCVAFEPSVLYARDGEGAIRFGRIIQHGLNVWLADSESGRLESRP